MELGNLKLYDPDTIIQFNVSFNDLFNELEPYGFILTDIDFGHKSIIHGKAWITKEDRVTIHFYSTDDGNLESFMVHSINYNGADTLLNSFARKQKWLESKYGKAQFIEKNQNYDIFDYSWELKNIKITHFIKDRFGDEEGIYFSILK